MIAYMLVIIMRFTRTRDIDVAIESEISWFASHHCVVFNVKWWDRHRKSETNETKSETSETRSKTMRQKIRQSHLCHLFCLIHIFLFIMSPSNSYIQSDSATQINSSLSFILANFFSKFHWMNLSSTFILSP